MGDPVPDHARRNLVGAGGRQLGSRRGHDLRLVRGPRQLRDRSRLPGRSGSVREMVAGGPPRHRQGHRPLPHHLLAGHALERRARGAAPRLDPWLAAGPGRADEQEQGELPRSDRRRSDARSRRRALRRLARGPVRQGRRRVLGFVRAALQLGPGQQLREPVEPNGLDGEPLSRRRAPGRRATDPSRRPGGSPFRRTATSWRRASWAMRSRHSGISSTPPIGRSIWSSPGFSRKRRRRGSKARPST